MPSADVYKRMLGGVSVANILAEKSNMDMELTWDEDIQSKKCYIYDYYHDDHPELAEGMSYTNTTKTPIDAKFIVTQYGSISKDQVEFHIMFRPSQNVYFSEYDDLYYYETDYRQRYQSTFPIGLYIDIPDEKGIYRKWLICAKEYGNQFVKYSVLPCEYYAMWIENDGDKRIKRKMWCCPRRTTVSNLDENTYFTYPVSTTQLWFPINEITEQISYTYANNKVKNQRIIYSVLTENPTVWKISGINNVNPFGILKLSLEQDTWNTDTDYVNLQTKEMFADYYASSVVPTTEDTTTATIKCIISATNNVIKIGGSYKLLTVNLYDSSGTDITSTYLSQMSSSNWGYYINNVDKSSLITVKTLEQKNQIRIKFTDDKSYLSQVLKVKFTISISGTNVTGELPLEIAAV